MRMQEKKELTLELFAEELNGDLNLVAEELPETKAALGCLSSVFCLSTAGCYMTLSTGSTGSC